MFKKKQSAVRWIIGGGLMRSAFEDAVKYLSKYAKDRKKSDQFIRGYTLDVLNISQIESAFAQANQDMSLPMTVINCAGIVCAVPFEEQTAEQFERQININLIGSRHIAASALSYLKQSKIGFSCLDGGHTGLLWLCRLLRIEVWYDWLGGCITS